MPYEVFTKKSRARGETESVSLTRKGRLAFNIVAVKRITDQNIVQVLLLWDAENLTIAIQPTDDFKDARAFTLRQTVRGSREEITIGFHAVLFLKHIGYQYKTRGTCAFPAVWNEDERLWAVELSDLS